MNTLADYTTSALMIPQAKGQTALSLIRELCSVLQCQGVVTDSTVFYDAVMARERLCPTTIAPGWALPHARLIDISKLSFCLARIPEPLAWPGADGLRARLVFLFAIPESESKAYLNIIAALTKLNQNPALLKQLLFAPDADAMFAVLQQLPLLSRMPTRAALQPRP